jgi:hypothetical protein
LIITLVFEKNAIFSAKIIENRRKLWSKHRPPVTLFRTDSSKSLLSCVQQLRLSQPFQFRKIWANSLKKCEQRQRHLLKERPQARMPQLVIHFFQSISSRTWNPINEHLRYKVRVTEPLWSKRLPNRPQKNLTRNKILL